MVEIKNVLLIGRTGSGKSALANVVTVSSKFKEGSGSTSETKEIQTGEITIGDVKYRIIDTVGIGDTRELSNLEELCELARVSFSVKDGLSQILLLTKDSEFSEDTKETYKLLENFFFDKDITKYTTIVRTHFPRFKSKNKCEEEKKKIIESNGKFGKEIESDMGIVFIDNPSIDISGSDEREMNEKKRSNSKEKIKERLKNISQQHDYKPVFLSKINEAISDYMTEEKKIKEKRNFGKKEEVELRSIKKEIVKKLLQHIIEVDPNFSKKGEIQRQMDEIEKELAREEITIQYSFNVVESEK